MKKFTIWQLFVVLLFVSNISYSQIISQYVETNSGTTPKGIEIWNNTAGVLDFTANNLVVKKGNNGGAPAPDVTISSGTLAVGAVLVIGTADMEATTVGNGAAFTTYTFTFNGDDALEIWYGATKTDVFGDPGNDPGNSWLGGGVETRNSTISLLAGITTGSLTGWTDPSTRFETTCTDNCLTGFGIAPAGGGGGATVAAPVFAPSPGTYYTAQNVTLTTTTAGADIYYTTDGTDPDGTSTLYAGAINVTATTTIKAIALKAGETDSPITTGVYTIVTPIAIADMATLRAQTADNSTIYQLNSEAFITYQQAYRNQQFIQDGTAGILIDDSPGNLSTPYNIGDGVTGIIGKLTEYLGMLEFVPVADAGAATSTGNTITPLLVTAADFVANFENYESQLVRIDNLTFADAGGTFATGQVYATADPNMDPVDFRTSFYDADYIGGSIPVGGRDIVGLAYQRTGLYLSARSAADITNHVPIIPLGSAGILIAGLLMAAIIVVRKGKLF